MFELEIMSSDPCERFESQARDGARIVACAHGGHLLGWTPAGGEERLWLSRDAECGLGKAIRGGIPIIWPQFSNRGQGPKHGLARNRPWLVRSSGVNLAGEAEIVMALEPEEATVRLVGTEARLELLARARGHQLEVTLTVENLGGARFEFTAALHTYLRVTNAGSATVEGLGGLPAEDNAADGAALEVPAGSLVAGVARDWAIRQGVGEARLVDPSLPALTLSASGFDHRVLWNPGPDGAPGDVHPGGAQEFVCIEPAILSPIALSPGDRWAGTQRLVEG